jgi:DNA-binding transcriptional ArsR family regulator
MSPADFIACAAAVADPTRLRMIFHLDRPLCVGQLAETVDITSSVARYHVRLMRNAGLVVTERRGSRTFVRRIEGRWGAIFRALATAE